MITNQRQYLNGCAQVERFRTALEEAASASVHPKATAAMRSSIQSQLEDLEIELREYEGLCSKSEKPFSE